MKRIIFLLLVSLFTLNITAQNGTSQFAVFSGYEQFPELMVTKGYNVGVELKHYMHNRIYAVANFNA